MTASTNATRMIALLHKWSKCPDTSYLADIADEFERVNDALQRLEEEERKRKERRSTLVPGDLSFVNELSRVYHNLLECTKALLFYADETRYHGANQRLESTPDSHQPEGLPYRLDVTRDGGAIARKALAPILAGVDHILRREPT